MNGQIKLVEGITVDAQEPVLMPDEAFASLYKEGKNSLLGGYVQVLSDVSPALANGDIDISGTEGVTFENTAEQLKISGIENVEYIDEVSKYPRVH